VIDGSCISNFIRWRPWFSYLFWHGAKLQNVVFIFAIDLYVWGHCHYFLFCFQMSSRTLWEIMCTETDPFSCCLFLSMTLFGTGHRRFFYCLVRLACAVDIRGREASLICRKCDSLRRIWLLRGLFCCVFHKEVLILCCRGDGGIIRMLLRHPELSGREDNRQGLGVWPL